MERHRERLWAKEEIKYSMSLCFGEEIGCNPPPDEVGNSRSPATAMLGLQFHRRLSLRFSVTKIKEGIISCSIDLAPGKAAV